MKTSVRFLAVLFALVMAMFTVAYAADYSDVEPSHANYDAIELLSTLGVLSGYEDGTFRPADPVQRDEMAKMVYIMATAFEDAGDGVKLFPDVASKHWASGFIAWAHTTGVVGGYEDGTFRPDENITYDEALKMASAILGYTNFSADLWPTDVRTVALKQLGLDENLDELKIQKVIENETIDTIAGDAKITRAQAAQIIYNCFYKTMGTKKTETYFDTEKQIDVNVEVSMTLAADVWNCKVIDYLIVGTENFAVKDTVKGINSTKTDDKKTIVVWDGDVLIDIDLTEFGLEEYEGKTDSILGFTVSKITKDGKDFALSGIKGAKYDGVSIGTVSAKSADSPTWRSGKTYWYSDRLNVNGSVYEGDDFWNLRSVYLDSANTGDPVFIIQDRPIGFSDVMGLGTTWSTPVGDFVINKVGQEVDFNSYLLDYPKRVWGIDSQGDGVIDYLFVKYTQPYKVKEITDVINNGVKDQEITLSHLYSNAESVVYKSTTTFASELKENDILIGAVYGNKLFVTTVAQRHVTHVTAIPADKASVTTDSLGKLSIGSLFVGYVPGSNQLPRASILDVSDANKLVGTNPDGSNYEITVWVNGSNIIASSEYEEPVDGYDKAVLLYVDKKTEPQYDKATNKLITFYPAYLLIDGKEEAVNLNPGAAIDDASGDYASGDESIYTAKYGDDLIINYAYKLVTYKKGFDGYYSLYTQNETILDEDGSTPIEIVIPEADAPVLKYNEATGVFMIETTSETYKNVDVDENTLLYYTYTKPKLTGDYKYMAFYTNESFSGAFEPVEFASDVYLTYNEKDNFYTISAGILKNEIESATGTDASIDYNKDARAIFLAAEDSYLVKHNGEPHYEHTLMNLLTGEITTATQVDLPATEAEKLIKGNFYAWSDEVDDYVQVNGSTTSIIASAIETIDETRSIIYTEAGSVYEEGIRVAEDFAFVAFDDDMNRYVLNINEISAIKALYDEKASADMRIIFITYKDENNEVQLAYALVDFAEVVEHEDALPEIVLHQTVNTNLLTVPTP